MLITSTTELHYPITVVTIRKQLNDFVERQDPLFEYSYRTKVKEEDDFGNIEEVDKSFYATFECSVEGWLRTWAIDKGTVVTGPSSALAEVEEKCLHSIQYGGMCAICGKDMTTVDYTSTLPETSRASTIATPNHQALRISDEEAARSDVEAKKRLVDRRKLSLVVDLDLTVIHASVDPTIKEWMDDESNPNHAAVEDVREFELYDEALQRNVAYYIKLRPNLDHFLHAMSILYELYIYTMGTRAYADNIRKLIDPDRKLFGDRILSRSETPGEVSKNLRKLFPVDNRMVVIIDDRADVWNWSNYLVRVQPFNFFVGIGDINSSFLPKQEDAPKLPIGPPSGDVEAKKSNDFDAKEQEVEPLTNDVGPIKLQRSPTSSSNGTDAGSDQPDGDESALGQMVSMQASSDASDIQRKTQEQDETLAAQLNERPLLQLQKSLEKEQEDAAVSIEEVDETLNGGSAAGETSGEGAPEARARSASRVPPPQTLLKDDDRELYRIEAMLDKIQNTFYNIFDERMEEHDIHVPDVSLIPDVKDVIERHRFLPLRGCRIVFSRLVPRHIDIMKTRWADMAMRLGAVVQGDISYRSEAREDTTHIVCKPGDPTDKMKEAASLNVKKRKGQEEEIKIVNPEWLLDGASQWWRRIEETPYVVYVEAPARRRLSSGAADEDGFSDTVNGNAEVSDAGDKGVKLRVETVMATGEKDGEAEEEENGAKSPEEDEAEWAAAFASDEEDEDFPESEDEGESEGGAEVNGTGGAKKRGREEEDDRGSESDGSSAGSSRSLSTKKSLKGHGSNLQRRKRRALERTSSLTNVINAETSEKQLAAEDAEDDDSDGQEAMMREALGEVLAGESE